MPVLSHRRRYYGLIVLTRLSMYTQPQVPGIPYTQRLRERERGEQDRRKYSAITTTD